MRWCTRGTHRQLWRFCVDYRFIFTSQYGQRDRPSDWKHARKQLITASNFSHVISRKDETACAALAEGILYPRDISHITGVKWGLDNEKKAISKLRQRNLYSIYDNLGLFQLESHSYIAATPDLKFGPKRILKQFADKHCTLDGLKTLYKKIDETGSTESKAGSSRPKTVRIPENMDAVDQWKV